MSREVVCIRDTMPLREAAQLLLGNKVRGAPVVNAAGRCVGVISTTDFLRFAVKRKSAEPSVSPAPRSCGFVMRHTLADGHTESLCSLPPGSCPIQRKQAGENGMMLNVCSQPSCVLADWQMVETENLPVDEVRNYMTKDLVTSSPYKSIRELARDMIESHIHRIIVVDDNGYPKGIVSGTDIIAAVAHADD